MAVIPCLRTALALAPFGPERSVRAFLARRPVLFVNGELERFEMGGLMLGSAPQETVEFPTEPARLMLSCGSVEIPDADWKRFDGAHGFPDMPGEEWMREEFGAASIGTIFDPRFPQRIVFQRNDLLSHHAYAFTRSPSGTIASLLERALLHGQAHGAGSGTKLTALLAADARLRVEELRGWVQRELAKIADSVADMTGGGRR